MDDIRKLADRVREVGYAIHCYLGPGHLEKIYENALVHRLCNQGFKVDVQREFYVHDEDGTVLGRCVLDAIVEDALVLEIKVASTIGQAHVAQILGYLRACRLQHGMLLNFGAAKFEVRKFAKSHLERPS